MQTVLAGACCALLGLTAGCSYEQRFAAVDGKTAFLSEQLDKGLDVNLETPVLHTTLLIYAAAHGHLDTVKMLVDRGADVNATDVTGWTPLHAAAYGGNPEIIRFLLSHGAKLTPDNWYTPTPLDVAEDLHHKEATEVLRAASSAK
jgi:uncharacterized protein